MSATAFLLEWAIRSAILITAATALLKLLPVKNPSIRLTAYTVMLCGSLVLPLLKTTLPGVPLRAVREAIDVAEFAAPVMFSETTATPAPPTVTFTQTTPQSTPINWTRAAFNFYLVVAVILLVRLLTGLILSRRLRHSAAPTERAGIRQSGLISVPVTVGAIRPTVILPEDWRAWDKFKLEAVLAHENAHIARHDPALQLLSAFHRAILWCNPLSWYLHSRIVRVAEEASDDEGVKVAGDPAAYAEILLEFISRAAPPTAMTGVSMARYGNPEHRIDRILSVSSVTRGVTRWTLAAILTLGTPITYLAASARPEKLPAIPAIVWPQIIHLPATTIPVQLAQNTTPPPPPPPPPSAPPAPPAPPPPPRPQFEVASIRPCDPNAAQAGGRGGGKAGGSTTRYRRNCVTVMTLIENAYIRFAGGENRSPLLTRMTKIEGGPGWLTSDQYTIDAEAEGSVIPMMMDGPMMQALLEERFQLRLHHDTREDPAYNLTIAKGGLKMQPAKEGPCTPADLIDAPFPFNQTPPAGMENTPCLFMFMTRKGPNAIRMARNGRMDEFVASLTGTLDRPVIDKTGINYKVDYKMVFAPDDSTPNVGPPPSADTAVAPDPAGPSIFTALEHQLGLKLESTRGAREYLVIDSVSRPSEN